MKAGTTEYRAVALVEVPEDYPQVVDFTDLRTRAKAKAWCAKVMLSGRATMAEVHEVYWQATEFQDLHYGRVRDAEERPVTDQHGWIADDGKVYWDVPRSTGC